MEVTVSQINEYIKKMFDYEPMLSNVSVKGEVSNVKYHTSGHIYFTIKDKGASLACVMFYGQRAGLKFKMETGDSVVVTGKVSVYEKDGKYQMYASKIDKAGQGDLHEKFEQLKKQLNEEGLFDPAHKKPLPKYAMKIGIVTSQGAAALSDIIKVAKRRNPYVELYLCPVQVQGDKAAATIAKGIKEMDDFGVDVMIVGRGGGSMEDLWSFNEECVARACYECNTPIVSAVGHEVDTTIIDFVADVRAATPSMAAELTVFDYSQFALDCSNYENRMFNLLRLKVKNARAKYDSFAARLELDSPRHKLDKYIQYSDALKDKLDYAMTNKLTSTQKDMALLAARLEGVSPLKKLEQGYSFTTDGNGKNIKSVNDVKTGDIIKISVNDGDIMANVL